MKTNSRINNIKYYLKRLINCLFAAILILVILCGPAWSQEEIPLSLPKVEGSKSFDLDIDQINSEGIQNYQQGDFEKAAFRFKKALTLAEQLRDPSRGILHYNMALSLHKLGIHGEAAKHFYSSRRYARGNQKILGSELLKMYDCGLNPNVPCEKKVPLDMNIEGSH